MNTGKFKCQLFPESIWNDLKPDGNLSPVIHTDVLLTNENIKVMYYIDHPDFKKGRKGIMISL